MTLNIDQKLLNRQMKKNSSASNRCQKNAFLARDVSETKKFYAVKRCSQGKIVNLFTAMIAHSFTIYYDRTMQQVCKIL